MEKKTYTIALTTDEKEPINKYYHTLFKLDQDFVDTFDFIDFNYPVLAIKNTEENIDILIEHLMKNGFEVTVEKK